MTNEINALDDAIRARFQAMLNQSGYGFQYRVLQSAVDMFNRKASDFGFEMAEVPVGAKPRDTRIDFVMRRFGRVLPRGERALFLVAECKRANPAMANWCFVRAPFTRRGGLSNALVVDSIKRNDSAGFYFLQARVVPLSAEIFYHIGIEVDSQSKGDPAGNARGQIENASTQVLSGLNGLVEFMYSNNDLIKAGGGCEFLPVVFTTANLWTCSTRLQTADLSTGQVVVDASEFQRAKWLIYQYNQSPGLKHGLDESVSGDSISDKMEGRYSRSVAFVSADGLDEFFRWATFLDLY